MCTKDENGGYNYIFEQDFTVGGLTQEKEQDNKDKILNNKLEEQTSAINNQTEAIKENNETNKNIFQKIGDIFLSIVELPLKLVNLLIDALKSLFVPSDDFISNFFTDLKDWFSDRLGFLFYPFELVIDILNKILNINFSEPVFNIPDINEPFTNQKLISSTTFNLNDMLSNSVFKNVHNIYLLCVDAFIIFALVNFAKKKFEEVTNK